MKKLFTAAFIIATIALGAQTKQKKACIKIDMEENGKVTKIDTCVTATTDAELQEKLNALGFGNPPTPPVPPVPPLPPGAEISIEIDSLPGDGYEYTYTKVISIDDEEDGKEGKKSEKSSKGVSSAKKMKVVSRSGKNSDAHVIVMDGEGNVITTDSHGGEKGEAKVVVKTLKPGEKMDEEIEKILKEHGIDKEKGEARQIIIKGHENKNSKETKEVKVYVFSKMEVKKLSEAEKKKLPAEASKALAGGKTFDNLNVSPNPTEDACTISYKSTSKEPLQIKVYTAEGKTVLTEIETGTGDQVNKTLSLKGLGQGVYFVHLTQGKQSEVRKVIVK